LTVENLLEVHISVENLLGVHISIERLVEWHISVENLVEWHIRILWRYQLSQINSSRLRPFNLHRNCWNCSQISSSTAALTAFNTFLEVEILHLCSKINFFLLLYIFHSQAVHAVILATVIRLLVGTKNLYKNPSLIDMKKCTKVYTLFLEEKMYISSNIERKFHNKFQLNFLKIVNICCEYLESKETTLSWMNAWKWLFWLPVCCTGCLSPLAI
jgi:hypothetical protein